MGLLQKAVETYDCHADLIGKIIEGHEVLAPVSHIVTKADLEITIDKDGRFIEARAAEKSEPKIAIPATEASAGRTSSPSAHPLCEQLGYLNPQNTEKYGLYCKQLTEWANSDYSHPKLFSVLRYIENGSILQDLENASLIKTVFDEPPEKQEKAKEKQEKLLIRWRVLGCGEPAACWEDLSLMNSFISWYNSTRETNDTALCMITGNNELPAEQHAKGIIPINGNAKLISSNDTAGFTYRGRFKESAQSATIGYDASQKAHNALRWLVAEQGYQVVFGGRTFLCWNPQGIKVPGVAAPFARFETAKIHPSDYQDELKRTLLGYQQELPSMSGVVIAAFDAATTGRLAITYYNELQGSDFLNRLYEWDLHCCWINGSFGIQSPSLLQIANYAYGTQRTGKGGAHMETDDRILKQQMQRLISCRIDQAKMPADIEENLANRASAPVSFEPSLWQKILFTACAVLNKYIYDYKGEDAMSWELDKKDRSFQFGRLLAVMDRAEKDFYNKTGEDRQTNALKAMSAYRQHPWHVYEQINRQLVTAYLSRIEPWQRKRYDILTGEIISILREFPENELNSRLQDTYLLGYNLQRNDFFKSKSTSETEE